MTERYPDDATLLAIEQDPATGVEMIPTGRSPYYLEFRKLVQRLLLASGRANDLRVYQDGDLSIGVRPGRCVIKGQPIAFDGATAIAVTNNATTSIWLDDEGDIVTDTAGYPADRTRFVPLADVHAEQGAITAVLDRRGEAFVLVPDSAAIGLTATVDEINQALAGVNATVDAAALNKLTGGASSIADTEHGHELFVHDTDAEAALQLVNDHVGASANIALHFGLTAKLPDVTALLPDASTGWLMQRYLGQAYTLLGALSVQFAHAGDLAASTTDRLMGIVPVDGVISDVVLSVGSNIESDIAADGVTATVKVNGTTVTSTDPLITDAAGAGIRSTAQGDGTAAVVKADGTQQVSKGDVLTVDLTRSAAGSVSSEAANVVVIVVVRAAVPE